MTPIERVSAKSRALATLGLEMHVNQGDLKAAFRKLAFEKHPDRAKGTGDEFARITDAFRFLSDNAGELGIPEAPPAPRVVSNRRISRPVVEPTESVFDDLAMAECRAAFQGDVSGTVHVASRLYRTGRRLTYYVATPAGHGLNRVSVPTGDLIDTRRVCPVIVTLDSRDIFGCVYEVSASDCAKSFPGARSVSFRFSQ
jgi:hypothetical protein